MGHNSPSSKTSQLLKLFFEGKPRRTICLLEDNSYSNPIPKEDMISPFVDCEFPHIHPWHYIHHSQPFPTKLYLVLL